ncbi:hypothetical protein WJX81_002601 [Elliptochloris bilobata]|uniref:sulfiredoxin n=1 Tax=Elliptochloris bilobata TaxID=381761 RepID=A0AAW1S5J3_9CHLO
MRTCLHLQAWTAGQSHCRAASRRTHPPALYGVGRHSNNGVTAHPSKAEVAAQKYGWPLVPPPVNILKANRLVKELPVDQIRRPLSRTRTNNEEKVRDLMESIQEVGLQEPIDVLEVEGKYYGFSGCHRYEAHQRLGKPTISDWTKPTKQAPESTTAV